MRSSTFSFEKTVRPAFAAPGWAVPLILALGSWLCAVLGLEVALAAKGYHATVVDSEALWLEQRDKADRFGARALILVGASRIQTDLDLDALRQETGFEPVQLALPGASVLPVLRGLAEDMRINGTIIVDYYALTGPGGVTGATNIQIEQYEQDFEAHGFGDINADRTERYLADWLHARLRSYADGSRPLEALTMRVLDPAARPQHVVTLPDRSRLEDFSNTNLPTQRYLTALSTVFGIHPDRDTPLATLRREWERRTNAEKEIDDSDFLANTAAEARWVADIKKRGGRVIFVNFPEGGMIRDINRIRFPPERYWKLFRQQVGAETLDCADVAGLKDFDPPDGMHLDFRSRGRFSHELVQAINLCKGAATAAVACKSAL